MTTGTHLFTRSYTHEQLEYNRLHCAMCLANPKLALLYFDKVALACLDDLPDDRALLEKIWLSSGGAPDRVASLYKLIDEEVRLPENLRNLLIFLTDADYPNVILPEKEPENQYGQKNVMMTILNMPIIEAEKASWEQILDLRNDPESRGKLRRLRMFLHTNYEGKSKWFIEDDILSRIDDFEKACKNYEWEIKHGALDVLLESKNLTGLFGGTGLGTLVFATTGEPLAAVLGAASGALIDLGKIAMKVAEKRRSLHNFERDHELAFIFHAKQKI